MARTRITYTPFGSGAMSLKTPEPPGGYLQPAPQKEPTGFGLHRRYTGHIPQFIEPFPPAYTYKKTPFKREKEISLEEKRKHRAQVRKQFKLKLIEMLKRQGKMISLLGIPTNNTTFLVPAPKIHKSRPAYITALLPHNDNEYGLIDNEEILVKWDEDEYVQMMEKLEKLKLFLK